ncbi:MAG TPA: glutamate--tRNA ligase family protein, partial [Patescibacteria group bacterium]|nr:glutamate--tRNA ligase family protein [Patescibacteria group bacterium]
LANVVDDHLMKISHVIRAEEWLSSTPKHLLLYRYFGWTAPQFAHMPLVLNEKRAKLSKRDGEVALLAYRDMGYLPEAMVNFLVFLGWNPKTQQELYSMDELIRDFDFDHVNKAGAIFNIKKLNWFNEQYIRKLSLDELLSRCIPYLEKAGYKEIRSGYFRDILALLQDRLTTLVDVVTFAKFFFEEVPVSPELLAWKKLSVSQAKHNLVLLSVFLENYTGEWNIRVLEQSILAWISQSQMKNGDVLWPMRVALSGQKNSPGPFEIAAILGREETMKRLARVTR